MMIYVRCKECLSIAAVEAESEWHAVQPVCGICGGALISMGVVKRRRLEKSHEECICNEACAFARGPKCECACGGQHHGSQMMVTVTADAGGIPTITPKGNADKLRAIAAEWRARLAATRSALPDRWTSGTWLPGDEWQQSYAAKSYILEACKATSQKGRLSKLALAAQCIEIGMGRMA